MIESYLTLCEGLKNGNTLTSQGHIDSVSLIQHVQSGTVSVFTEEGQYKGCLLWLASVLVDSIQMFSWCLLLVDGSLDLHIGKVSFPSCFSPGAIHHPLERAVTARWGVQKAGIQGSLGRTLGGAAPGGPPGLFQISHNDKRSITVHSRAARFSASVSEPAAAAPYPGEVCLSGFWWAIKHQYYNYKILVARICTLAGCVNRIFQNKGGST